MARRGPLITLLGGGALAGVLLIASINAATSGNEQPDLAGGEAPPTEAPEEPDPTEPPDEEEQEQDEDLEPITYVGWVDGGGASVAIIVTGDEATAYVCDGFEVEVWLEGSAANGELVLRGDDGELLGSYDDDFATGQTTVGDLSFDFTIEQVDNPEGLYQFANTVVGGAEVEGTWIILPDGTQVGVATIGGEVFGTLDEDNPAPHVNPDTGEVLINGELVTALRRG
jgi:hypothetical protein